jgi:hypothetical protein
VNSGEVTPTGGVREVCPIPTLHGGDGPRILLYDRMPRILLAAQFPNVASLKHLMLLSLLFSSGPT